MPSPPAPPTRPALRERFDRRRAGVIDAAAREFATRGYAATSMEQLSEATGLAAGGLYHYIESKEQLLFSICDELLDPLLAEVRAIAAEGDGAEATLRRIVRAWVAHVERHRDHMLVFQRERQVLERDPRWAAVRRARKAFERLLDDVLARGEASGELRFAPDRQMALRGLLAMVNYLPQWYRPGRGLDGDQVADGFCDLVLRAGAAG